MDDYYSWIRVYAAVIVLATDGPLQLRLRDAYANSLCRLEVSDLPPELRLKFGDLQRLMKPLAPYEQTQSNSSPSGISDGDAQTCAIIIAEMYDFLAARMLRTSLAWAKHPH
jgi:hypothetical protein